MHGGQELRPCHCTCLILVYLFLYYNTVSPRQLINNIKNCTLVVVMATVQGSKSQRVFTPAASSSSKVCTPHLKNGQCSNSQARPHIPKQFMQHNLFNLPCSACPLHVTPRNAFAGSCKHSLCCVSVFISSREESHRNSAQDTHKHTQVNAPDLPQLSDESD